MKTELKNTKIIKKINTGNYGEYRIPGICVTSAGTILISLECRSECFNDWADIDIAVLRSEDGGNTFTEQIVAQKLPGEEVTWNNPTLIPDKDCIHLIFCRNYEKMFHAKSSDDGKSFGEPSEITAAFKDCGFEWNVCAAGPGHGLCDPNGTLYVPVWLANGAVDPKNNRRKAHAPSVSGLIFSRDKGRTWNYGDTVKGLINGNETSIALTRKGTVLLNVRHCGSPMYRALSRYSPESGKCSAVSFKETLPDPMCYGGSANLPDGTILFSNCSSNFTGQEAGVCKPSFRARTNLTVHYSQDDGETWHPLTYVDGTGGYSDIAVYNNTLYVLYERTEKGRINDVVLKEYELTC